MSLSKEREDALIRAASNVREQAYAPYSGFRVGAAVLAKDGTIFTGCNVENASYGLSMCAERNAVAAAVAGGCRTFAAIVLVTDTPKPVSPCGACRQVLAEFGDFPVIMVTTGGLREELTISQLLPRAFNADDMS